MLRASRISHSLAFFKSMARLTFPRHSPQTPAPTLHQYSRFGAGGTVELEDQLPSLQKALGAPWEGRNSAGIHHLHVQPIPPGLTPLPTAGHSEQECAQSRAGVWQSQGRTGDESEPGAKSPALFFQKSSDFREKTPGAGTTLSLALPNPSPSLSLPGKASTAGQGAHNNFWTKHF